MNESIILGKREEKIIQAFRDHLGTFIHLPANARFLPIGKFHGAGKMTLESLIDKGLLEEVSDKGWRLTSLGWEVADA